MIAKEDSDFLHNAYRVWDEVFEDANKWPDTIFLLLGYRWGYDNFNFESHTLYFACNLPQTWRGTLIIVDGNFGGGVVQGPVEWSNVYSSHRCRRCPCWTCGASFWRRRRPLPPSQSRQELVCHEREGNGRQREWRGGE